MQDNPLKIVDAALIARVQDQAKASPRGRKNYNLHDGYADPIQRLLNAMQPGTYVRPHRHPDGVWELFILLAGACSLLIFDDAGQITDRVDLAVGGAVVMEVPVRAWHAVVVTAPDTLIIEAKPGPYSPLEAKDFAPWAADEGQPGSTDLCRWMEQAQPGQRFTHAG